MPKRKLGTADGVAAFFMPLLTVDSWQFIGLGYALSFSRYARSILSGLATVADEEVQHFELIGTHYWQCM